MWGLAHPGLCEASSCACRKPHPHPLAVCLLLCVSRVHTCAERPSARPACLLATCVLLEPRVFIADFKYLFHGRQTLGVFL